MTDLMIDWQCDLCHYDQNPQSDSSCAACGHQATEDCSIAEWLSTQGITINNQQKETK